MLCSLYNEWTDGAVQWEGPWVEHTKEEKSEDEEYLVCYIQKCTRTRVLNLSIRICNCRAVTQFRIHRHKLSFLPTIFILVLFLPCSSLLLLFHSTCSTHGPAQHTAPPAPTSLLSKLINLHFPHTKLKKNNFSFMQLTLLGLTLMMKAETSSEMSVTTILTNQQSSIFHMDLNPQISNKFLTISTTV
jgi:hypothetical protein